MIIWKRFIIFSLCMTVFTSAGMAETTLVIATGEYPPYVSERPEESFLTDIFHEVAKEMGVTFEFKFMPWKRCEDAVEELKAWGAIPYTATPEREQKFYFSDPLYFVQSLFFAHSRDGRRPQIPYNELTDLKNYRIGGVLGYYYEKPFREAGLKVEYVPTGEQNFRKLRAGRIDLTPSVEGIGWYLIKKLFPPEEVGNFFTLPTPLNTGGDFLITSKRYPDTQNLLARFNTALKKIKEDGVFQKVLDQHEIVLTIDTP